MVKSMTGYGRGLISQEGREITVEIKTLNHRYLDISMRLPRNLSFFEDELRKRIQSRLARGRVEVYINYQNNSEDTKTINVDFSLLEAYFKAFQLIKQQTHIEDDTTLSFMTKLPDVLTIAEKEDDEGILKRLLTEAVDQALETLLGMRELEGEKLSQDILYRTEYIREMVEKIKARAPLVVDEYKEKLSTRIQELLNSTDIDDARFNTEVAFFADRSSITEEIVRLLSHVDQLTNSMSLSQAVGRKLDFIIQEMNREINTIGSKASDLEIINMVVDVKSEIEKIREQVQNIE